MTKRKTHSRRNSNKRKTMRGGWNLYATAEPGKTGEPVAQVTPGVTKTWTETLTGWAKPLGISSSSNTPVKEPVNTTGQPKPTLLQDQEGGKKRRNRKSSKK